MTTQHPQARPVDFQYETALLAEECGEVTQIIGKSLRFGWQSYDPANPSVTNLDLLHDEVGDVLAAIQLATDRGLLNGARLDARKAEKTAKLNVVAPASTLYPGWTAGNSGFYYQTPPVTGTPNVTATISNIESAVSTINTGVGTKVDTGLTAAQERLAAGISIVFGIVLLVAVWFGATRLANDTFRLEASRASAQCYRDSATMDVSATTCESLQKLSGDKPAPVVVTPVAPGE